MHVTTYGYQIPDTGDKAKGTDGWMAAIVFNFNRLDDHNHDGINSALIPSSAFATYTSSILAANWVSNGSGYKQTITVPGDITEINNFTVKFVFTAPVGQVGQVAPLNYKRLTATTYEVYCSDNTAAFTAYYR